MWFKEYILLDMTSVVRGEVDVSKEGLRNERVACRKRRGQMGHVSWARCVAIYSCLCGLMYEFVCVAARKEYIAEADDLMARLDETIGMMRRQARSLPPDDRKRAEALIRNKKSDVSALRTQLVAAERSGGGGSGADARRTLFGDEESGMSARLDDEEVDQSRRLLAADERSQRTSSKLSETYAVAQETEAIGASTLRSLYTQRETLTDIRDTVRCGRCVWSWDEVVMKGHAPCARGRDAAL